MNCTRFSMLAATVIALLTAHTASAASRSAYEMDLDLPLSCDDSSVSTVHTRNMHVRFIDPSGNSSEQPSVFAWRSPLIFGSDTRPHDFRTFLEPSENRIHWFYGMQDRIYSALDTLERIGFTRAIVRGGFAITYTPQSNASQHLAILVPLVGPSQNEWSVLYEQTNVQIVFFHPSIEARLSDIAQSNAGVVLAPGFMEGLNHFTVFTMDGETPVSAISFMRMTPDPIQMRARLAVILTDILTGGTGTSENIDAETAWTAKGLCEIQRLYGTAPQ